ncbi:MAG: SH3 domain-containing protein [Mastigocoleus sp. MO_188.B34]|nr:SH3 domain-containing protein [Mastigocoleus sp. MO_188.B34]MDJ0695260.1 SH3 domain-containing protein [Mastigocoleus sp. MO_188.B34]
MFVNILKFLFGFALAIAILAGGGVVAALYFINRNAVTPNKPMFDNDRPPAITAGVKPGESAFTTTSKVKEKKDTKSQNTPSQKDKQSTEEGKPAKPLPPGAYNARVTWSQGLVLRSEPNTDAESVGGVGFNKKVIVLQVSQDKAWQKVRVVGTDEEAWVKAGNTKRTNE